MKRALIIMSIACAAAMASASPQQADFSAHDVPQEAQAFGVDERLGETIPLDLQFTNAAGEQVALSTLFTSGKPVVLVPQYYECPMLCGLVMNGVNRALNELRLTVGTDFHFVGVSIDHDESYELAAAKQKGYAQAYGRDSEQNGWHFLVGQQAAVQSLMESVGYGFVYDQERDEFAHSAALIVLTPEGKISRYLYGIDFSPRDMRLALVESSAGKIGTVVDRLLLFCYHYDPQTRQYALLATRVMRGGAVVTVLGLGALIAGLRRRPWVAHQDRNEGNDQC